MCERIVNSAPAYERCQRGARTASLRRHVLAHRFAGIINGERRPPHRRVQTSHHVGTKFSHIEEVV